MTILNQELKRGKLSLLIWTLSIGFMVFICMMMFPEMKGKTDSVSDMFSSMGSFTAAFGMDKISLGEIMGFYGIECGNILGLGGAFFAGLLGISALANEEKNHTAEFLLTHPVSRTRVVFEKLAAIITQLFLMNIVIILISVMSFAAIGEELPLKEFALLHLAYFLLQFQISAVCFGISAFIRRGNLGIGLGLAAIFYFLNLIANISEQADFLKYITPFSYADSAGILSEVSLEPSYILPGMVCALLGIGLAFYHYDRKDIAG